MPCLWLGVPGLPLFLHDPGESFADPYVFFPVSHTECGHGLASSSSKDLEVGPELVGDLRECGL